jgi:twitching motility two-component system response regulator PilG
MQGKLSEIDIRSILQLIELGQRTGELFVEAYPSQPSSTGSAGVVHSSDTRASKYLAERFWFVFFLNGQIVYTANADTSISRLTDYLHRYKLDTTPSSISIPAIASTNAPEYNYLWTLLETHVLTPAQGRSIIRSMVHETLFDLLSLHQGSFIFELGPPLSPQLTTLEVTPLLAKIMKQVQQWKQLHPHIQSPDQYPVIASESILREALSHKTFNTLDRYTDGKTSIRQIARYLNRDILTIARAIYPYIQNGAIQLVYPPPDSSVSGSGSKISRSKELEWWHPAKTPRIVCIDDGVTVREIVEQILGQHGYEATSIGNPLKALSLVFQLKPDLILCDIAMPELDGYEICAMLRKSTAFRQIPIIMLTGKDGFIDRVRAKMVGATDYLTKPFGEGELLMLVEKYVGSGSLEPVQAGELFADLAENALELDRVDATSASSAPFS